MDSIQPSSRSKPGKYRELENYLRRAIEDGTLPPGSRLPSFADLRQQFGMAPSTVSHALMELEQAGLLNRRRGSGIYVAQPPQRAMNGVIGFQGFTFRERYLPYWMTLMESMEAAAHAAGFELLLLSEKVEARWEKMDGLLLHSGNKQKYNRPVPPLLPRVALMLPVSDWPTVDVDDALGGRLATQHLVDLGHRRIAYLCFKETDVIQARLAGYHAALRAAEIVPSPSWIRDIVLKYGTTVRWLGRSNMEDWLARGWKETGCTALLAQNDEFAWGAMEALQAAGINVPGDVSVVGFDGTEICSQSTPQLTSISVPLARIGALAVEMLLQQIRGQNLEGAKLTLPPHLQIGGSTAPPRNPL